MIKEQRYIVLKKSNLGMLTSQQWIDLLSICAVHNDTRANFGRAPLDCVVVESDWPEYEGVLDSIAKRSLNV